MPIWTMTHESNALHAKFTEEKTKFDELLMRIKRGVPVEHAESTEVILRMDEAYRAWMASMPRREP